MNLRRRTLLSSAATGALGVLSSSTATATASSAGRTVVAWDFVEGQPQGEVYLSRPVRSRRRKPAVVIYHHGATGTASGVLADPYERRLLDALTGAGYMVLVSDFGGSLWGNGANHRHITDLITVARVHGGRTGPVALLGTSMGGGAVFSYAGVHPHRVACAGGFLPVIDLDDLSTQTPSVDSAYLPAYADDIHGLRHSPLVMASTERSYGAMTDGTRPGMFSGVPLKAWYGTEDLVCKPEAVRRFARTIRRHLDPQVRLQALLGAGHALEALDMIETDSVVEFVGTHLPV